MLDRVLRLALGVLIGAWIARHLGPQRYGELSYAVAFLLMFQALGNLNLDGFVVRDISQTPEKAAELLGTALRLRLTAGAVAWGVAVFLVAWIRPGDGQALLMIAILGAGLVFQSTDVVDLWFQSRMRSRLTVMARLSGYCLASMVKVVLILSDAPLWSFAVALMLDFAFTACALVAIYKVLPTPCHWSWNSSVARALLRESFPFLLANLAINAYMRVDLIVLRELADESALGFYSAALPFSQAWSLIPTTAYVSLLPVLSALRASDPEKYRQRLQAMFSCFFWAGVVAVVATFVFAEFGLIYILGEQYAESAELLKVHSIGNVFLFLGVAQGLDLVASRSAWLVFWKAGLGLVTCILINYSLIPVLGALGAAWASVFSQAMYAVVSNAILDFRMFKMQVQAILPRFFYRCL